MTFLELYGDRLDRELGSADRTHLFTTARRQAAIQDAQRDWVRQTECLVRESTVSLVDEVGEYDLERACPDFWFLTGRGPALEQEDAAGTVTVLVGEDLPQRTVAWLDREDPGWRQADPGTPTAWYLRPDGGRTWLGLTPMPDIGTTDLWTLRVPYVAEPADLVADSDEPFTVHENSPTRLRAWHQALVHRAAASLELLRRDRAAHDWQLQRYATYVTDYLQRTRARGGSTISFARDYRGEVRGTVDGVVSDPRR